MGNGGEVGAWRKAERARLIATREALPSETQRTAGARVRAALLAEVPELAGAVVALYWPFRGEVDLAPLAVELVARGSGAALPVIVEKNAPLAFWRWEPGMATRPGVWGIPVPASGEAVLPDCLLVPLVGFDGAGHRLGYGGGYYDRTLAALPGPPPAIGVGYAFQRLPDLRPQPHDRPMDAIATEEGLTWHRRRDLESP